MKSENINLIALGLGIIAIAAILCDFYTKAQNEKDTNNVISYVPVSDAEAQRIESQTGQKVYGYTHSIDSFAMRHINSHHGNQVKEQSRNQIAITLDDIALIPRIITNPDSIKSNINNQGKNVLIYSKNFDGILCYLEEIRTGKKQLAAVSMWKSKC